MSGSQTMTPDNVLAVLDGSACEWSRRLARYRRDADKANARKGARDIHADRVCEWAEVEREKVVQARAAVVAMIDERDALLKVMEIAKRIPFFVGKDYMGTDQELFAAIDDATAKATGAQP